MDTAAAFILYFSLIRRKIDDISHENTVLISRHLFDTPQFEIEGLSPSTTYWMKFRWKTGAGPGPFTPYIRVRIGRFVQILVGTNFS